MSTVEEPILTILSAIAVIFIIRFIGAWMLRINELIKLLKNTNIYLSDIRDFLKDTNIYLSDIREFLRREYNSNVKNHNDLK